MKVLKCREKAFLQRIFGILRIAHQSSREPGKLRNARSEEIVQLVVIHVLRQFLRVPNLRTRYDDLFL
jgi:hypothetical protein